MELRKYFLIASFVLANYCLNGQSISIEPAMNDVSNGLGLLYNHSLGIGWQASIGPRYQINTFSINNNIRGHWYYQNGFANTFTEHFGSIARVSKKLYSKGSFRIDGFSNLLLTYTSLKSKFYHGRFGPITPDNPEVDIFLMEPGWSYELTIGPKVNYNVSNHMALHAMAGYGINFLFYNDKGVSLVTDLPIRAQSSAGWQYEWEYEMVGFEFLPMLSVGFTYSLEK